MSALADLTEPRIVVFTIGARIRSSTVNRVFESKQAETVVAVLEEAHGLLREARAGR